MYKKYKGLIENITSLSLLKVMDLFIPLLLFPYLVAVVGEEKYGIYAFCYTLIFYFLNVAQYGFSLSAVKTIALVKEDRKKLNEVFNEVFFTKLFLTFASMVIIGVLILIVPQFRENYLIILYLSLILVGDTLTSIWFFQGIEEMKYLALINLISKGSFILLAIFFVKAEADYEYIGLYHSIGFLFAGVWALLTILTKYKIQIKFVSYQAIKGQIKHSFSSFLILITPTLYSTSSILMLGFFYAPMYVTYLEAGLKISGMFSSFNTVLTTALYPFLNRNQKYKKNSIKLLLVAGFVFSVIMFVCSDFIVRIWLKEYSYTVVVVINILSLSPFMLSVISAFGVNKLLVEGKERIFLKATFLASATGLILGFFLIMHYGLYGAVFTIMITRTLYALFTYICTKFE